MDQADTLRQLMIVRTRRGQESAGSLAGDAAASAEPRVLVFGQECVERMIVETWLASELAALDGPVAAAPLRVLVASAGESIDRLRLAPGTYHVVVKGVTDARQARALCSRMRVAAPARRGAPVARLEYAGFLPRGLADSKKFCESVLNGQILLDWKTEPARCLHLISRRVIELVKAAQGGLAQEQDVSVAVARMASRRSGTSVAERWLGRLSRAVFRAKCRLRGET